MMCLSLGAPDREAERKILLGEAINITIEKLAPVLTEVEVSELMNEVNKIHVSSVCLDYLQDIIEKSRQESLGLSPRAGRDFNQAAKAYAYISGREFVIPEDYQQVGAAIMSHRLESEALGNKNITEQVLSSTPVH